MDTSFFSHAPKQGATQYPDNRDLNQLVNVNIYSAYLNPDYRDHADAYIKEHAKKEVSMPLHLHCKKDTHTQQEA